MAATGSKATEGKVATVPAIARALAEQYAGDGRRPQRITIEAAYPGLYMVRVWAKGEKEYEAVQLQGSDLS